MTYTCRCQSDFCRAMRRVGLQSLAIAAMIWHEIGTGEQTIIIGSDIITVMKG